MLKRFKLSIPVEKRIILHLADYVNYPGAIEVDNAITQQGIANAVNIRYQHVSRAIIKLIQDDHIFFRSVHVKKVNRRKKAYFLSIKGIAYSKDIKKWFDDKPVFIRNPDNELREIRFYDLKKILKFNIKPLEAFRYAFDSDDGIIDLKQVIKEKKITHVDQSEKQYIFISSVIPEIENFYGREKELDRLKAWINDRDLYKLIMIHGMAGIGKTTLTSKLVGEYRGNKHIFWHDCNKWDTKRSVLSDIAGFLSKIGDDHLTSFIDFNKPLDIEKIMDLLENKMKQIDAIFVFDDFHKINGELKTLFANMIEILDRVDRVNFIISTRYVLPFYEQQKVLIRRSITELEIAGLDFESSSTILNKKGIPEMDYKRIYYLTSGNPLLLEIIESYKKTKRYIYDEIFSNLTKEECKILEILSIYRSPIPYDALYVDNTTLPESIDDLVNKLIIKEAKDGQYYTHDFIKDFFYKRLSPFKRCEYHEICAQYYLDQVEPKDYCETIYHFIRSKNYQTAIELAIKYAQNIIDRGLSERLYAVLAEISEFEFSLQKLEHILMLKARLCFINGNWDRSIECYHQVIGISTETHQDDIVAQANCEIGHILEEQNIFDRALAHFKKSLKISKKINNNRITAEAKRGIGRYYWRKSKYDTAEKYYLESLTALKNCNDPKLIGSLHIDLGNIYFEQYKVIQAFKYYKSGLKTLKRSDDNNESLRALNNLGTICYVNGKFKDAIKYFERQLSLAESIGDIRGLGYGLSNIGCCCAKSNQIEKAKQYIDRAMELPDIMNNENILFTIYRTYGLINKYYKKWDDAIDYFNKSLAIIKKLKVPFFLVETLLDFGLLYEEKCDLDKAQKCYQKAHSIQQKVGFKMPKQLKDKLNTYNKQAPPVISP